MAMNLTCSQVGALLSFYINDKLNPQLKQFVKAHLEICPQCREKYEALKKIVESLKEAHEKIDAVEPEKVANPFNTSQYKDFQLNLSAYIDNELSDEDNLKIKKYAISNPIARKDLENMYSFRRLLQSSFEKARNEVKDDFSKFVMSKIDFQNEVYSIDPLLKAVTMMIMIIAFVLVSALMIFWV